MHAIVFHFVFVHAYFCFYDDFVNDCSIRVSQPFAIILYKNFCVANLCL